MPHAIIYVHRDRSHGLKLTTSYKKNGHFTFMVAKPLYGIFCYFFSFAQRINTQ